MGKYKWSIILIVLGSILLLYAQPTGIIDNAGPNAPTFNPKKLSMTIGGILVAIGGIMAVLKSQSK